MSFISRAKRFPLTSIILILALKSEVAQGQSPAPQPVTNKAELSLQISKLKNNKIERPQGIIPEMLVVRENGRRRKVVSVTEESKSLSIVLVINLGVDPRCGFTDLGNLLGWLGAVLDDNLSSNDELSITITDIAGQRLLGFGDGKDKRREILGRGKEDWKGKIAKWNVESGEMFGVLVNRRNSALDSWDTERYVNEVIFVQPRNHMDKALKNSVDYLLANKKMGNRSVLLFCNSIHNLYKQELDTANSIEDLIYRNNVLVGWIGEPLLIAFDSLFSGVPWQKISIKGYEKYASLIGKTGGDSVSCGVFNPTLKEKEQYENFSAGVKRILDSFRTRYKITYESDNSDFTQPRNIKLEMSPKWKGGKVTLHYPKIIYPQTPEK
jgi:hypothetical protein